MVFFSCSFFTLFLFTFVLLGSNSSSSSYVLAQSTVDFSSVRVVGDRQTNDLVYLQFDAHLMPMEQNWRCTADLRTETSMMRTKTGTCDFLDVKGMAFKLDFALRDPLPLLDQAAGPGSSYSLAGPLVLDFTYSFGVTTVDPISFATEVSPEYLIYDHDTAVNSARVSLSSQEVVSVKTLESEPVELVSN